MIDRLMGGSADLAAAINYFILSGFKGRKGRWHISIVGWIDK
jgi:hypothetical protein